MHVNLGSVGYEAEQAAVTRVAPVLLLLPPRLFMPAKEAAHTTAA
jgi:hypothetical protein